MEELYRKYSDRGFSVVAIEAARDTERAVKFIEKHGLSFHLLETEEENDVVDEIFGVNGFPAAFMIDRDGKIVYYHLGFEKGDEEILEREILSLLSE